MKKTSFITAVIGIVIAGWLMRPQLEPKLRDLVSSFTPTTTPQTAEAPVATTSPATTPKKIPAPVRPPPTPSTQAPKPKTPTTPKPTFTGGGALVGPAETSGVTTLSVAGVITITNQERAALNLSSLKENGLLNTVAARRVKDMFDKQYFAHDSPSGITPSEVAKATGYSYLNFGENIALGNFASDRELVTAWMNSPGHRKNIVDINFTEIGVAVGQGIFKGEQTWIAVQVFGRPVGACPAPDKALQNTIDSKTAEADSRQADLAKRKTELEIMPHNTQAEVSAYNQEADEYNRLTGEYNALVAELRNLTAQYNNQLSAFNACLNI